MNKFKKVPSKSICKDGYEITIEFKEVKCNFKQNNLTSINQ